MKVLEIDGEKIHNLIFKNVRKRPVEVKCCRIGQPFKVATLEGVMQGKAGDWLVVGVNGEMYPIDNEIFQKTYDVPKEFETAKWRRL